MSDFTNLKTRQLNTSSVGSIVNVSNRNFKAITDYVNGVLDALGYDEAGNALRVDVMEAETFRATSLIQLSDGNDVNFQVSADGKVTSVEHDTSLMKADRLLLDEQPDRPDEIGVRGEIVWDGLDFYGFTDSGWLSLTGAGSPGGGGAGVYIGTPDDGDYGDGFFAWDPDTRLPNAMQDVNEKLKDLDENSGVQQVSRTLPAGVNTDISLGAVSGLEMTQVVFTAKRASAPRAGGLVYVVNEDDSGASTDGGYWSSGAGYALGLQFEADVDAGNLVLRCKNTSAEDITFNYKTIEITK